MDRKTRAKLKASGSNQCSSCGAVKPLAEFRKNRNQCWDCIGKKQKKRDKRWNRVNAEARRSSWNAWASRNPESRAAHDARRRGRERDAKGSHTAADWRARIDFYGGRCRYCGVEGGVSCDHRIPLARGGTNWPSNLVPACLTCNMRKGTMTETEFLERQSGVPKLPE